MNNILSKLQTIDYIIVAVYLLILLYIGYTASFGKKKEDETLFLAGKSLRWYSIGFNMWGTNVGPSMLLAFASIGLFFCFFWRWCLHHVISPAKSLPCPSSWDNVMAAAPGIYWHGTLLLKS